MFNRRLLRAKTKSVLAISPRIGYAFLRLCNYSIYYPPEKVCSKPCCTYGFLKVFRLPRNAISIVLWPLFRILIHSLGVFRMGSLHGLPASFLLLPHKIVSDVSGYVAICYSSWNVCLYKSFQSSKSFFNDIVYFCK